MKKRYRGNRDLERKEKKNNNLKIFCSETKTTKNTPNPLKNRYRDRISHIFTIQIETKIRGVEMMRYGVVEGLNFFFTCVFILFFQK